MGRAGRGGGGGVTSCASFSGVFRHLKKLKDYGNFSLKFCTGKILSLNRVKFKKFFFSIIIHQTCKFRHFFSIDPPMPPSITSYPRSALSPLHPHDCFVPTTRLRMVVLSGCAHHVSIPFHLFPRRSGKTVKSSLTAIFLFKKIPQPGHPNHSALSPSRPRGCFVSTTRLPMVVLSGVRTFTCPVHFHFFFFAPPIENRSSTAKY